MLYSTSLTEVKNKMQTRLIFFLGAGFEGIGEISWSTPAGH